MLIAIAGPYSASTEEKKAENLRRMNEVAAQVLQRGHVPMIGANMALPMLKFIDDKAQHYEAIMKISLGIVERCDAILMIGESPGANRERDLMLSLNRPVYWKLEELPKA